MAEVRRPAIAAMSRIGGLSLALAVLGLLILDGGRAQASHVDCGDTITADTTLDSDLVNCPNNGIVIGADGITLDLDGHRVDGDGAPSASCDPETEWCDVGVLNDGHDGVTVKHGSVREFDLGVVVGRAHGSRILRVSATKHVTFGGIFFLSSRSLIRNSTFSHNIPPEGDGIGLFNCRRIRVIDSTIRDNAGPGIHVGDAAKNAVKRNLFVRNGPALLIQGNGNRVRDNRIRDGGGVLVSPGKGNVIAGNRIARAGDSITIERGHGNLVASNTVIDAHGGTGITLGIRRPPVGGSNNVVRRNRVKGSEADAFFVAIKDNNSRLKGNVAVGAGDDGFDVRGHLTKLTRNRAFRNADLGIFAVHSVIDGGGNIARLNGNPLQCTNILCS